MVLNANTHDEMKEPPSFVFGGLPSRVMRGWVKLPSISPRAIAMGKGFCDHLMGNMWEININHMG